METSFGILRMEKLCHVFENVSHLSLVNQTKIGCRYDQPFIYVLYVIDNSHVITAARQVDITNNSYYVVIYYDDVQPLSQPRLTMLDGLSSLYLVERN